MSSSWIEISESALFHNIKTMRGLLRPETKLMAVVKANAYGHGLEQVSGVIEDRVDWFGVDSLEEAEGLCGIGVKKPILVLGYLSEREIKTAVELDVSFVVYREDSLRSAERCALLMEKKAKVHLKIETGTNRQGIRVSDIPSFVKALKACKNVVLEGVYTHYADIEDTLDSFFAMEQLGRFKRALGVLRKEGCNLGQVHTAATAATMLYPETHFDMVRVGIGLYGLWPSRETKLELSLKNGELELKSVLAWKAKVVQIKKINKGESVGYGRTWWALRESKIAVLPVGYYDGYDRGLSSKGEVLIRGEYAPVVGRVAMNMMMVDVTDVASVGEGDEVVLIGWQGGGEVSANNLAALTGTISYEVVARINPKIERQVVYR